MNNEGFQPTGLPSDEPDKSKFEIPTPLKLGQPITFLCAAHLRVAPFHVIEPELHTAATGIRVVLGTGQHTRLLGLFLNN